MRYYKYRNNRNGNKYIEVVRYSCGHYAFKQYIKTYKFICFGGTAYTIMKCDTVHDSIYYICRNIRNKDAAFLMWQDVKNGIQK